MSIVFAILLFSLLIFLHELGHFVAAKLSGVQVNEFSMFMGPAIFKKKIGDTLYTLRCIPIGGYCAMEGEDTDTENPRSFQKAAWWKRLCILLAGSFMNLITGIVIFAIVFAPAKVFITPLIANVEPGCTIVREEGLQIGDRFLEIDGEPIYLYGDVSMILSINGGQTHDIVVERQGRRVFFDDYQMETHLFPGEETERYGFSFGTEDANFKNTAKYVINTTVNTVRSVRLSLQMLFTGKAGLKDLTGPVGVVQIMSDTASEADNKLDAFLNMLYFGGFIAINLGVMNLLPIPALDGGRVICLLVSTVFEKIARRKLNPKYEGYLHGAFMILLLLLMAVVMFKDIFTIFKG